MLFIIQENFFCFIQTFQFTNLSLGCIFTMLKKLIGLKNSGKKMLFSFTQEYTSREMFAESLLNFSTIPNLLHVIYKTRNMMHVANCSMVSKTRE